MVWIRSNRKLAEGKTEGKKTTSLSLDQINLLLLLSINKKNVGYSIYIV